MSKGLFRPSACLAIFVLQCKGFEKFISYDDGTSEKKLYATKKCRFKQNEV